MGLTGFIKDIGNQWNKWGIEAQVLASFALQIILTFFGNRRRNTPGICIKFITWSSYILSGLFLVKLALGKLAAIDLHDFLYIEQEDCFNHSKKRVNPTVPYRTYQSNDSICQIYSKEVKNGLMELIQLKALLAPLLLLQIGNPDCLTAYSIEDNRLGLRQYLGLLFQVISVVWILVKSYKKIITCICILANVFDCIYRYGEVAWALKSALVENSGITISEINQEANVPSLFRVLHEKISEVELIAKGYYRFNCLKPPLNNLLYQPFYESLSWMSLDGYSPEDIFKITNVELGFMYDVLYTKAPIIYTWKGFILRIISLLSLIGALCGFVVLPKVDACNDERILFTYAMLIGALVLEVYQIMLLPFSDWAIIRMITHYNKPAMMRLLDILAPRSSKWKRWSNSVAQFNLLNFCLHYEQFKFSKILKFQGMDMYYIRPNDLKELNVEEMKEVDKERGSRPFTQRGEWAL